MRIPCLIGKDPVKNGSAFWLGWILRNIPAVI